MYKQVTKKRLLEGMRLCKNHGYWSKEVSEYINKFEYPCNNNLSSKLGSLYNSSCNLEASIIYDLAIANNLL